MTTLSTALGDAMVLMMLAFPIAFAIRYLVISCRSTSSDVVLRIRVRHQ